MEEIGASENDQPERRLPRRTRSLKDVISNISSWKERRSLQRAEARQAADGRRAAAQREALGRVWDRGQLKAGHLVDDADVAASQHPNTWTPHGVIKTAFEATSARHGHSTRNTCHVLDTLYAVAFASKALLVQMVKGFMELLTSGEKQGEWVLIMRAWDGTPTDVEFGELSHLLCPHARYHYRPDKTKRWQLLSYDEYLKLGRSAKRGSLELFAQTAHTAWNKRNSAGFTLQRYEVLPSMPVFLQNTKGSCMYRAVFDAWPGLSMEHLRDLTTRVLLVVLVLGADDASSCNRLKAFVQELVA